MPPVAPGRRLLRGLLFWDNQDIWLKEKEKFSLYKVTKSTVADIFVIHLQMPGVLQHMKPLPGETPILYTTLCFMDQAWDTMDQVPNQQCPLRLASSSCHILPRNKCLVLCLKSKQANGIIRLLHLKFTMTVSFTRISPQPSKFPLVIPWYQTSLLPLPQQFYSTRSQGQWESRWLPGYVQVKVWGQNLNTHSASLAALPKASQPAYSLGFTNRGGVPTCLPPRRATVLINAGILLWR